MTMTRRRFAQAVTGGASALAAIVAASPRAAAQTTARPNSRIRGVQLALNAPYNFGNNNLAWDEVLFRTVTLGVNALELRSQPIEGYMGWAVPNPPPAAAAGQSAAQAIAPVLRAWRRTADLAKAREMRQKYDAAGVAIEIVKFDNIYNFDDQELDYAFTLAKAVGARAISCEISAAGTARVGAFADKHQLMVGYHGHAETTPADWQAAFAQAKFNGANLDIGHFVAGNNGSPVPFMEAHHDRITHVHVKDRKRNNGPNVAFGQGDTPIAEVLRLIRDRKWNIQATIEFEYPVPAGSDRTIEQARALEFCRQALGS
jgi:sugar phosphate isomerase/epimerase